MLSLRFLLRVWRRFLASAIVILATSFLISSAIGIAHEFALQQDSLAKPYNFVGSPNPINVRIVAVDSDNERSTVEVESQPDRTNMYWMDEKNRREYPGLNVRDDKGQSTDKIRLGPLLIADEHASFLLGGVADAQLSPVMDHVDCKTPPTGIKNAHETLNWELVDKPFAEGSIFRSFKGPLAFPFDEYLLLGEVRRSMLYCGGREPSHYKEEDEKSSYFVPSQIDLSAELPGWAARRATANDLYKWPILWHSEKRSVGDYKPERWISTRFAIVVTRPLALRRLTLLLVIIVATSGILLALTCQRCDLVKNLAGSILSIWTVRSLIMSSGPKTYGIVDLAAMTLFALLALIYLVRYLWEEDTPVMTG